jgi:phosphoribosyl 1,2-cyclic phosphate phosphodiesterase
VHPKHPTSLSVAEEGLVKITFLGTGTSQGIPMVLSDHPVNFSEDKRDKRLRSSVLISWKNAAYLIDCGPDFRYQMLRAQVQELHGIFFTHEHADHVAGLDDIRPFCYKIGAMPVYAQERVLQNLRQRFAYIFQKENRYPGVAHVSEQVLGLESFVLKGVKVQAIEVSHGNLPIYGYRFGNIAYLTDVKTVAPEERMKLKGLDVLVVNALRIKPHHTHFNLEEALNFVREIQPKRAYFTHISHLLGFHETVTQHLPENVFLAYDGLEVVSKTVLDPLI